MIERYPYPQRPSEYVRKNDLFSNVAPIQLDQSEREKITLLEDTLFGRLKKARDFTVTDHTIYPEAFTTEEGQRLFSMVYLTGDLTRQLKECLERNKDLPKSKKDNIGDRFFDRVLEIAKDEQLFKEMKENGIEFENIGFVKPSIPRSGNLDTDTIESILDETDLKSIPKRLRERLNTYSSDFCKSKFKEDFKHLKGDITRVDNPRRVSRIVNADKLTQKVQELRDLKKTIKELKKQSNSEGNFDAARNALLSIYERTTNVYIADLYADARVLALNGVTEEDKEALGNFKGLSDTPASISRSMERIDHFLEGTGIGVSRDGLLKTTPLLISRYAMERFRAVKNDSESENYKKYNAVQVGTEQIARICQDVLAEYGFDKLEKPWTVIVDPTAKTFRISSDKKTVNVPPNKKLGLVDCLAVVAHEIEGHVLRSVNKEKGMKGNLKIIEDEELSTGRSSVLSEAAAMHVEDLTKQEMVGESRVAEPYYYIMMARKQRGGSFRACFKAAFKAYSQKEFGMTVEEVVSDSEKYDKAFEYLYPRVIRIFRKHTPFSDTSGYIASSDQLSYIEQEPVVDSLISEKAIASGLSKILYVSRIDLYSLEDLQKLGLDLSKIEEPKYVVARKLWPKIKEGIDKGEMGI